MINARRAMEETKKENAANSTWTSTSSSKLSKKKTRQGTYYGDNRGAGACSYQFSGVNGEPWVDGVAYRVALNSRQVKKEKEREKI
jgi:hypothetical protein